MPMTYAKHHLLCEEANEVQQPIVERYVERAFGQRIVNNVERGFYVECMIELALRARDPDWRLMSTWDPWDVEHTANKARLEIKQSAALNPWTPRTPIPKRAKPVFGIKPVKGYWGKEGWRELCPPRRLVHIYIFAWHSETNWDIADHRCSDQWTFVVVDERHLPQDEPLAKSIGLGPLNRLADEGRAAVSDIRGLGATVAGAVGRLPERTKRQRIAED